MPSGDSQSISARSAARKQSAEAKRARGEVILIVLFIKYNPTSLYRLLALNAELKLKCDKSVPCGSCKRRGCASICPNGSLVTGEGTRFVLADTEKLHQKIARMSDRIRQLEDALSILQSTITSETHPLLDREMLKIKSSVELHAAVNRDDARAEETEESQYIDAFGTLAIRDDGAATFYGRSAGSESLLIGESSTPHSPQRSHAASPLAQLPPQVTNLSGTFLWATSQTGIDVDYLSEFLPSWEEACRLSSLYLDQAPWFFGAVQKRQIIEEILPLWYEEAPQSSQSPVSGTGSLTVTPNKGGAHELALLFVIFCFGALTDMNLPPAPDNILAERYYGLTKAALTVEPVLERPPSVATVQTLSLMAIYEGLKSGDNSIESTWALMGIATKLAQSIGLHRDCARWKLTPAEVQKRRALYHELAITDCWQSLATGRLPTFTLPFVDCELPLDTEQTIADDGSIQPSFPYWKARFGAECVSAVVQGTLTSRAPKYSVILDLDRKVRDIELPKYAQGPPPQGLGLSETMSHFMPTNYRELTLLYIHRCFFAHAIRTRGDPLTSPYAPSFLAGYRSACDLLGSIKIQFSLFSAQIARFWVLWTHAFSAAVMISSVVTKASKSKVAPAALLELKGACDLFEKAASYGGRAVKFLPILRRLQAKAQKTYYETSSGIPTSIPNDIFRPSSETNDNDDEIAIFSGKTHTLTTRVNGSVNGTQRSPQPHSTENSRPPSDSPPQAFTDNPAFAGVHPGLISELNGFEGQLTAQLQKAYHADSEGFTRTLMGLQQQPSEQRESQQEASPNYNHVSQHSHLQHSHLQRNDENQRTMQPHHHYLQQNLQQNLYPSHHRSSHHHYTMSQSYPSVDTQVTGVPVALVSPHSMTDSQSYAKPELANMEQYPPQSKAQPVTHSMSSYVQQHPASEPISPASSSQSIQPTGHYPAPDPRYASHQRMQPPTAHYWSVDPNERTQDAGYTSQFYHPVQQTHHYTDYNVGMPAEDHSLQETWQTYMHKVGSPRLMFEE